jgi:hypothetical protein
MRGLFGMLSLFKNLIVFGFFIGVFTWYIKGHSPKNSKYYYIFWGCTIYTIIMQVYYAYNPVINFTPMDARTGAEAWEQNMR